ncbi:hypothetical protein AB205_0087300 [Aquarana catesbeiana]|uniref:Uncharacterized protein n=1 Tax=Aquarana catesbeiana TaxID=8400 RepID=A0A2G9QC83_AQUCT|nr:hypothetical protein AB205_0087300 [Aquarana catesbeiana]
MLLVASKDFLVGNIHPLVGAHTHQQLEVDTHNPEDTLLLVAILVGCLHILLKVLDMELRVKVQDMELRVKVQDMGLQVKVQDMELQVKAQDMELLPVPQVMDNQLERQAMVDLVTVPSLVDLELQQEDSLGLEDTVLHQVVPLQLVGMVHHLVGLQDMEDTSNLLDRAMEEAHQVRGMVYQILQTISVEMFVFVQPQFQESGM